MTATNATHLFSLVSTSKVLATMRIRHRDCTKIAISVILHIFLHSPFSHYLFFQYLFSYSIYHTHTISTFYKDSDSPMSIMTCNKLDRRSDLLILDPILLLLCRGAMASAGGGTRAQGKQILHDNHKAVRTREEISARVR